MPRAGIVLKKVTLECAEACGNDAKSYRYFEVPKATFYRWKKAYALEGKAGLVRKRPVGRHWPNQLSQEALDKILHLRQKYHLGPQRIA